MNRSTAKAVSSNHRVYLRPGGAEFVRCEAVSDQLLASLAESAHEVIFGEGGPNQLPSSEISRLLEPITALAWSHQDLVTDPALLHAILLRKIADNRKRLALRTGKHLLAGVVRHDSDGGETLVLVFAGRNVLSCDWQLAG